ncbi:uncharacterized protein BP01DRAFT_360024 [Aspergillus saccharolyticus JOP 1030-1]|uniref:Uncharacterized protein n=1 Tax=Aspergillus saccharolyticus JOP 1030-1 TaxID=1450539 RepID=A0A318Z3G0_9EURO|nr:hypothetical protein BP01DRAFT_360024 [Aspergillus saccharolyticus JOP 1030-1]PYH41825.1 hypothetical protein BP01DRAFT_360024 [Aspergillus saccharolyticus JOP 1030-1]
MISPDHTDKPRKSGTTSTTLIQERHEVGEVDHTHDRQHSLVESKLSHHLYFEDNDGFFPPSWLGQKPRDRAGTYPSTTETGMAEEFDRTLDG